MPRWIVNGHATVNVCAYVTAGTPEEALERAGWGIYAGLEQMGEPTGFVPDDDEIEEVVRLDQPVDREYADAEPPL